MSPNKHHFAAAASEISNDQIDAGLWAMATAKAQGDSTLTHAIYLRLRAEEFAADEQRKAAEYLVQSYRTNTTHAIGFAWDLLVFWFYSCLAVGALLSVWVVAAVILGSDQPDQESIGKFMSFMMPATFVVPLLLAIYKRRR